MLQVIKGKLARPRRVLLYGEHGIGKTTWAASAENPIVVATENGADDVGVDRTPLLRTTNEVGRWLIDLRSKDEEHGYKTVVIDSLDWLERLIWAATCKDAGKTSIEDFGYGRGYQYALKRWEELLLMLDCIRNLGITVVLLAHAKVERFSPPDGDPYDRWAPDLHKSVAPLIHEWCDEVFFAALQVDTITKDEGFGQTRTRAIGSGDRLVHTCAAPTHAAKRRIELPDQIPLVWSAYRAAWPKSGNVSGIVRNGSSKTKGK